MPFNRDAFFTRAISSKLIHFDELAEDLYRFQQLNNPVLQNFIKQTRGTPAGFRFLPVELFKTQQVCSGQFDPELVFTSSTTSGGVPSRHLVREKRIYTASYLEGFRFFYGDPSAYTFLCLLPSYLERQGSSLIEMARGLISLSNDPDSGFYLYDFEQLESTIKRVKQRGRRPFLLGVTFALLDFAETCRTSLAGTIVMETGGMKGRKSELTRNEVHELLGRSLGVDRIHAEYGMTELLSQAYAKKDGLFTCPPWMKVFISDPNDPFCLLPPGKTGIINVIDLANIDSCAFIQTSDLGRLHENGSFEVLGRMDHSEVRGCSLMYT